MADRHLPGATIVVPKRLCALPVASESHPLDEHPAEGFDARAVFGAAAMRRISPMTSPCLLPDSGRRQPCREGRIQRISPARAAALDRLKSKRRLTYVTA
ncbi:MAG: hypothetical protein DCF30_19290 [Hyphomicrobiales bacterium]|nr:MAG: hypothetical protein DCF30_19290 [Hyphomicrobiales bacterium]